MKIEKETYKQLENREEYISIMESFFDIQNEPEVGTFWYDAQNNILLFVNKVCHTDVPNNGKEKTTSRLHITIWQHEKNKALSKGLRWKYPKDYTQVPRGRVWYKDGKSIVTVGQWINDYPQAKEVIADNFELTSDVEYRVDPHWNIGSGWSGDRI